MKTLAKAKDISKGIEKNLTKKIDEEDLEVFEQVLYKIISKTQDKKTC